MLRGHSFEFRINGEDPGRSFMPAPGTIEKLNVPTGPGVRWDSGFVAGDVIEMCIRDRSAPWRCVIIAPQEGHIVAEGTLLG